jgi:hypothetical protein
MPFKEPTAQFANYFQFGWNRLEGRSRQDDFASGLSASIADPLWALGRQWQMLELKGDEAGTPSQVELTYEVAPLDRIALGRGPFEDIGTVPVTVIVEREAVDWDWRLRVRAGQHFERLVRLNPPLVGSADDVIKNLRLVCPFAAPSLDNPDWLALDYATRRFVALMTGRVIDGKVLWQQLDDGNPLPGVSSDLRARFLGWYAALYYAPGQVRTSPAWTPEQLDYDFRIQTSDASLPGPVHAPAYRNGSIDWDAFLLEQSASHPFESRDPLQLTPVHVTFAGQPMRRWWEFEDRAVNLGKLDVAKTDIAKLPFAEFALRFGDDWFVVPLTATPNTFLRVRSLQVRDCFGQVTEIPPAREPSSDPLRRWEVFSLAPQSSNGSTVDFLYVPPVSGGREESPIIEEIRFARDEDANVVFAIERTVPNASGEPTSGFAAHLERLRRGREQAGQTTSGTSEGVPTGAKEPSLPPPKIGYVLATKVPANWIPFIATDSYNLKDGVPQGAVKLQRAAMVSTDNADAQQLIQGMSRMLQPDREDPQSQVKWIEEAAVGREGVRVELRRHRMRSPTGETYVWLGRKVGVGKGEARSGLRFDAVVETNE